VEGVLAAGAVNNSREGGNLIPTVAFGIPGSISMAILLSAFLLKGLVPGPAMLTRNLEVTYAMVWVIVLSNLIAVSVSFAFLNQLVRLTYVRAVLLVPFLMVLTAFGAYTAHNSFADIVVMLVATLVGVAAIRWDWPRAPLLLALVLGDIAERYLFLSYSLFEWQDLAAARHRLRGDYRGRCRLAADSRPARRRRAGDASGRSADYDWAPAHRGLGADPGI
jgi:TctA family transporter